MSPASFPGRAGRTSPAAETSDPPTSAFLECRPLKPEGSLAYRELLLLALMWLVLFDRTEGIRFTHSPSGGGVNSALKTTNPAWDFQFLIPQPELKKEYGFRMRTVLRPRCSRDELLHEFENWKQLQREVNR